MTRASSWISGARYYRCSQAACCERVIHALCYKHHAYAWYLVTRLPARFLLWIPLCSSRLKKTRWWWIQDTPPWCMQLKYNINAQCSALSRFIIFEFVLSRGNTAHVVSCGGCASKKGKTRRDNPHICPPRFQRKSRKFEKKNETTIFIFILMEKKAINTV